MGLLKHVVSITAALAAACALASGGGAAAEATPARVTGASSVVRPVLSKHQALRLLAAKEHGSIGGLRYTNRSHGEYWLPVRDYIPAALQQVPVGTTPPGCAATGSPAVLLSGDTHVAHSAVYRATGASFRTRISPLQTIRWFRSAADAQASYEQYRSALADCEQIVVPGAPGMRMDREYRPGPVANSFRTTVTVIVDGSSRTRTQAQYTARVANTVVSFWGDDASKQTVAVLKALVEHAHHAGAPVH